MKQRGLLLTLEASLKMIIEKEKHRIEKTIQQLSQRLELIEENLASL